MNSVYEAIEEAMVQAAWEVAEELAELEEIRKKKKTRTATVYIITTERFRVSSLYRMRHEGWHTIGISTTPAGNIMLTGTKEVPLESQAA